MKTQITVLVLVMAAAMLVFGQDLSNSVQQITPFKHAPGKIDLPDLAVTRAREVLQKEHLSPEDHGCSVIHAFFTPSAIQGFARKQDRVFIVRIGGFENKGGSPVFRFLWIHENGSYLWEP
jgi:hypothetical protein